MATMCNQSACSTGNLTPRAADIACNRGRHCHIDFVVACSVAMSDVAIEQILQILLATRHRQHIDIALQRSVGHGI